MTWRPSRPRQRVLLALVVGVVLGFVAQLAVQWFVPQTYLGPSFGQTTFTCEELAATIERGKNIHGWYARMPWRTKLASGVIAGESFDVGWIRVYDAVIERLDCEE